MAIPSTLKRTLLEACKHELTELGFTMQGRQIATVPTAPGFQGWLGLNVATRTYHDRIILNPNIGLRYETLHKLHDALTQAAPSHLTASFVLNLGYATPYRSPVSFECISKDAARGTAKCVSEIMVNSGLQFLTAHSNITALFEMIARHTHLMAANEYLLTLTYLVKGELAAVEHAVGRWEELTAASLHGKDAILRQYRKFIQAFERHTGCIVPIRST